jgi:ribosome-associated protein
MEGPHLAISATLSIPLSEIGFRTSRSGGPGGQNVNKLETRVELLFDLFNSPSLSPIQRTLIITNLKNRIDESGVLRISVQDTRSQFQNKALAVDRFVSLLRFALRPRKKRRKTRPSESSRQKRLESKRRLSEKKRRRKNNSD